MTMAIGMLIRAARNTRVAELMMRLRSSVVTFSPPPTSDVPKSPVTTSPSQDVYWVDHGPVQAELLAQRLVARHVGRLFAEDRPGGVAGQRLRGDEHDECHQEERQQAERKSYEEELQKRRHIDPCLDVG